MERLDAFLARASAAYYGHGAGIGADFTTAPEMTQAFGECLGLWSALAWEAMGRPARVVWAECGPGRGTLIQDALRAVEQMVPAFASAAEIHLVETSPVLRAMQKGRMGARVSAWHDRIEDLPGGPLVLLGNEFLDALPIRQFIRREGVWRERWVSEGQFVECPTEEDWGGAPEGSVKERCEPGLSIAAHLGARLAREGGVALFLDYGPGESGLGDSLQAMKAGKPADPLADPGAVDVTAHVDFAAFAAAAAKAGATAQGPVPMGLFLQRLGLVSRSAMLARVEPFHARNLLGAAQRLVAPEGMGRLFKSLALTHPGLPPLEGFRE
ncbi:class I SAM-dependent methyltransferase [Sabulicella glaciei]|uniref:SAM-dependent methyltransferase n=1 Tax=Sabulicella glaciei TaxID=2984948 RepID=A0ABT3NR71_9PROT|nr:SAM-dependent methyltransferase [Roseococcus sp. MDT2-1-1]MCW8084632.1 SAM-dependent methyltransferase [Roseococcus sp. MDT2-1-1]